MFAEAYCIIYVDSTLPLHVKFNIKILFFNDGFPKGSLHIPSDPPSPLGTMSLKQVFFLI